MTATTRCDEQDDRADAQTHAASASHSGAEDSRGRGGTRRSTAVIGYPVLQLGD